MAVTAQEVISLARILIAQRDPSSPDATDNDLLYRLNEVLQLQFPQEMKLFNKPRWYEFQTVVDQLEYEFNSVNSPGGGDVNNVVFSNLMPPVYVNHQRAAWYQDVTQFFDIWGLQDESNINGGNPTAILFWDNKLTVRPKPNAVVTVLIQGYPIDAALNFSDNIPEDYWKRYLAYALAVNFLSDFGEYELLNNIYPIYVRHKAFVLGRTASQLTNQSGFPRF